jgi:hypothetical protein
MAFRIASPFAFAAFALTCACGAAPYLTEAEEAEATALAAEEWSRISEGPIALGRIWRGGPDGVEPVIFVCAEAEAGGSLPRRRVIADVVNDSAVIEPDWSAEGANAILAASVLSQFDDQWGDLCAPFDPAG